MQVNKILAGLLAVQLFLGAAAWFPRGQADVAPVALVDAKSDAITTLEITGMASGDKPPEPVRLQKQGEQWILASANNYPADSAKVKDVLDKITGIELKETVATQKTSHEALSVAEDKFTRKVTLAAGGQTSTFYLGAGQSSSANVRRDGTDEVYVVHGLTAWSIGDSAARYYDTSYVKIDANKVNTFTVVNAHGTLTLKHDADGWVDAANPALQLDQKAVMGLIRRLGDLRISKPTSEQVSPQYGLDGSIRVQWQTAATDDAPGQSGGYTVGSEADNLRYVKADDKSWVVQVASSTVAQAANLATGDLLPKPIPAPE